MVLQTQGVLNVSGDSDNEKVEVAMSIVGETQRCGVIFLCVVQRGEERERRGPSNPNIFTD